MSRISTLAFSAALCGAVLFVTVGCSKEGEPTNANANSKADGGKPGPNAGRAPAARMEVPKPKPSGPLPSKQGSRFAKLETIQSGRFVVTVLAKNRKDIEAIEAKELECTIMCNGKTENVKLIAKPSPEEEKAGKCSKFQGYSDAVVSGKPVKLVVTFPSGEPKLAHFEMPAGYRSY